MEFDDTGSVRQTNRPHLWLLAAIAVVLGGWALHAMATVFIPVVCAIFVTLVVYPLDKWVADRVPERLTWLGHAAAVGAVLLVVGAFFGSMWLAAERLQEQLPDVIPGVDGLLASEDDGDPAGGDVAPEGDDPTGSASVFSQLRSAFSSAQGLLGDYGVRFARTLLESAGGILGGLVLIFFLTLLMLVEQPRWRSKLATVQGAATGQWLQTIDTIASKIRRYLLARTILGLLTAALYTIWLWIFGIDLLLVWALLTFVLNYIPNLGSLVSGALPVLYALLTRDVQTAALVGAGILAIEQIVGNFIDPRVQGRQVSVSPVVVLVALLVWSWIWGVAGALLAVPIVVAALVIFAHIPALRSFALLLSRERDMQGLMHTTNGR